MADFPRGWALNNIQNASGVASSVTAPATPGVVHVLDSLYASAANFTGGAVALTPTLFVVTAAGTVLESLIVVAASAVARDSVSFSGLDIASSVGGTIVLTLTPGPPAGCWLELTAQGHDI